MWRKATSDRRRRPSRCPRDAHKEPALEVESTQTTQQGTTTNVRNLTTDGKENTNTMRAMGAEQDIKSTTKWDGNKLVTALTVAFQGVSAEILDTWDLSADGKVLTISRQFKTSQGDLRRKPSTTSNSASRSATSPVEVRLTIVLFQDIRYALRNLWHGKGFATVAIACLGSGSASTRRSSASSTACSSAVPVPRAGSADRAG